MTTKSYLLAKWDKAKEWFLKEGLYYRIFWTTVIVICVWNVLIISISTLERYFSESVSIGIETTYLQWNNTFPAVTFCLIKNRTMSAVEDYVRKQNLNISVNENNYVKILQDYIFINANDISRNLISKTSICTAFNETCGVDILRARREILPGSCEAFMQNVTFLGKIYKNCSDIFKFHDIEMGYCYLANNILDYKSYEELPLKYSINEMDYSLEVYLKSGFIWKYVMYIHSPENIPYFDMATTNFFTDPFEYNFQVTEFHNDEEVKEEPITQRLCKFPNEKDVGSPWHYSFSTCMSYLKIQFELEACNCTVFTSPPKYKSKYCDLRGLKCVSDAGIPDKTKNYVTEHNACYPSCLEQEITDITYFEADNVNAQGNMYVKIKILDLPTMRYNRVVNQSYLDLVVAVGGIIGLFVGLSVLNLIEFAYICLCRKD